MKKKIFKYLFLSSSVMLLFSACVKDSFTGTETKNSGKTYVWITESPEQDQHFLPFTDIKTVTLFTVRRDAANSADLSKAVSVKLTSISIDDYNTAHQTTYVAFPGDLVSQAPDNTIVTTASDVTLNFQAGAFAKNYAVNIDGSKFDPSQKYAVAYVVSTSSNYSKKVGKDTILATLGVKNIYDGVYHASGTFVRVGIDQRTIDEDKTLGTLDATTVSSTAADLGEPITLQVNPDNTVTVTFVGQSLIDLPGPFSQLGENTYDPATKTFTLHYQYRGNLRQTTETLTLK